MEEETNTQELAKRRAEWADERTRMAGERTYFAWLRTGLALVAAGLATSRLLSSLEPQWLIRTMGVIFIALGGSIFALGFRTYYEIVKQLSAEEVDAPLTGSWASLHCCLSSPRWELSFSHLCDGLGATSTLTCQHDVFQVS